MDINLQSIHPNPWQTRLNDDPEHIQRLADDIAANGLLQTPLARIQPGTGGQVELAFGHSRFEAFKLLKRECMPLDIRELTDRQMSDFAASENAQRRNLSAIETATAIQRRIADFKLSQMEAAKPFGYTSQGGVSNLLRLLKLPEHTRELVHAGAVPERIARLLLPVARMSQADADKIADVVAKVDAADRDEKAVEAVDRFLEKRGRPLDWRTPFKQEWPAKPVAIPSDMLKGLGGAPAEVPACQGCEFRLELSRRDVYCTRPACYEVKCRLHFQEELCNTSKRTGIAIAKPDEKTSLIFDGSGYDYKLKERAAKLAGSKSDILRLALVPEKDLDHNGRDQLASVTGSRYVMLLATNKVEAERIMSASSQEARKVAQANETEAQKARRIEREEAQREEGRAERAKQFRARADINWLIETAGVWLGKQIDASGGALEFLANEIDKHYWRHGNTSLFDAAIVEHEKRLSKAIGRLSGKDCASLLRERIVVQVIAHELAEGYGVTPPPWFNWPRTLTIVARVAEKDFKAKLPVGWNDPPIHHGSTNCWQCGKFGSNIERITNGEKAKGWIDGGESGVFCSDAHQKQYQSAQAKPVKKASTKK